MPALTEHERPCALGPPRTLERSELHSKKCRFELTYTDAFRELSFSLLGGIAESHFLFLNNRYNCDTRMEDEDFVSGVFRIGIVEEHQTYSC